MNLRTLAVIVMAVLCLAYCLTRLKPEHDIPMQGSLSKSARPDHGGEPLDSSCQHSASALRCVTVVEVHDGDTLYIDLPEAPAPFAKRMPVRVLGIDAPEISSKDPCEKERAVQARELLASTISNAKRIDIVDISRDKYFRIDGVVLADGVSIGDTLLKNKLAYVYHGDKKSKINWCKF